MRNDLRVAGIMPVALGLLCLAVAQSAAAPLTGTLSGAVTDPSGAVIPGATVRVTDATGQTREVQAGMEGRYVLEGLAPGKYTLRITAPDMAAFERAGVEVKAGTAQALDAELELTIEKEEITVSDTSKVDVDPSGNVGAIVLKGSDLDALPDDPDDLEADRQALAGPTAGPNGGQIYIDGFSGGRPPPSRPSGRSASTRTPFRPSTTGPASAASRSSPSLARTSSTGRRSSTSGIRCSARAIPLRRTSRLIRPGC